MDILFYIWDNPRVDLNETRIFTKVVEAESFVGAARALGMPKSTVSRKIAQLETRLGARLLQRTTRRLRLSDIGRSYYERCAGVIAALEEAEEEVGDLQAIPRGTLRVTAPVEFGIGFLGEILPEFLGHFPDVDVEVDLSNRLVDLVGEGYDLAIRAGPLADSTLIGRKLIEVPELRLFASPAYLLRHGAPLIPADLKRHSCIVFGAGRGGATWSLAGPRGEIRVPIEPRVRANSFALTRDVTLAGLGIALMPAAFAREISDGRLQSVLEGWATASSGLYAVYPSGHHLTAKVRAFLDFLGERLDPSPWPVGGFA